MSDGNDFAAAFRSARQRMGLSQNQAARALGVPQPRIVDWEAARLRPRFDPRWLLPEYDTSALPGPNPHVLASWLTHEDGTAWTVAELLDAVLG